MQALQKAPRHEKRHHEAAAHRRVAHTVIQEKQIHVIKVPFLTLQRAASFHALLIRAHQWKWVVPLNPKLPQQPFAPYHPGLLLYLLTAYDKKDGNLDRQVLKCTSLEYKLYFYSFQTSWVCGRFQQRPGRLRSICSRWRVYVGTYKQKTNSVRPPSAQ